MVFTKFKLPLINVIVFGLGLVATPFLILQNYLQSAIGQLSEFNISILDFNIPTVLFLAIIFLSILFIFIRKSLTLRLVLILTFILGMMAAGQYIADFYFDHHFWDLQHNWHYLAYGVYSLFLYRWLKTLGLPLHQVVIYSFLAAVSISVIDEVAQVFISSRIFDIGDIAKDAWGMSMGMILVLHGMEGIQYRLSEVAIRHPNLPDYFRTPLTILIYQILFVMILLSVGSLLTETGYVLLVVGFTIVIFLGFFMIVHISQFRLPSLILSAVIFLLVIVQGMFVFLHRNDQIVYNTYGFTVYKGIAIPFFDVMIFPDGSFRLVDKKHFFNRRDQNTLQKNAGDILLIGSGANGLGGKGFPSDDVVRFEYNQYRKTGMQIIVLPTSEACREFNRMKSEGKSVLFVIHNTC